MDPYLRTWLRFVRWQVEAAPSERAFLEGFFPWIYTARAQTTAPSTSSSRRCWPSSTSRRPEDLHRYIDAFVDHETTGRLAEIAVPTLVLAGGRDMTSCPTLGGVVADRISGARFEVMEEEAHQPFQEIPDQWNARVDAFWREIEAQG